MNFLIAEDATDLSRQASKWLEAEVRERSAQSVFLPAGKTPETLYALWEKERPAFLDSLSFKQIDDVMTGTQKGIFKTFFEEKLPSYRPQFTWIEKANETSDVSVLGLGLNGHVAFHEPHLPKTFYGGCVQLSATTCQTLGLEPNTWGLTYGASTFLMSRAILMIASGSSKQNVVQRLRDRDPSLPATALLEHRAFTLMVDRAAV